MKTERFEIRLDAETLDRIDYWRGKEEGLPSRTDAIRSIIEDGLSRHGHHNARISDGEKLSLMMMCELYEKLGIKGEYDPKFIKETIYGGHYWGFRWQYNGLFHDHSDDPRSVTEVVDILDMWRFLEEGFGRLSESARAIVVEKTGYSDIGFLGFDHNDEIEYSNIASYMVDHLDRFTSLAGRAGCNSHAPMLSRYRLMLQIFTPMRKTLVGKSLDAEQISEIITTGHSDS